MGALRLSCNFDHDKLHNIANNHRTLHSMLGHSLFDHRYRYALQTLKDNISLFTPEIPLKWISKGKAGVSQGLGLKVFIVKDQFGFILHHRVMEKETDGKVEVPIIKETKKRFDQLTGRSFDKGFRSPDNQKELSLILDKVILPRKGKLSAINKEIENSPRIQRSPAKTFSSRVIHQCPGKSWFRPLSKIMTLMASNGMWPWQCWREAFRSFLHIHQQKEFKHQQRLEKRLRKKLSKVA